jgi:hypothetical protein
VTAVSTSQTLTTSDTGKHYAVTTGASNLTVSLPTASSVSGQFIQVSKADTGAGTVTIASTLAVLYAQNDVVLLMSDGSGWLVVQVSIAPRATIFAASGSYSIPPLATRLYVEAYGAGGGGGRGGLGGSGTLRTGGAGGGGGGWIATSLVTAGMSSPVTVTVGAGGAGSSTATSGSPGGRSSFGNFLTTDASSGGVQGLTSQSTGGLGGVLYGTQGGNGLTGGSGQTVTAIGLAGGGGGAGSGILADNTSTLNAGTGGNSGLLRGTQVSGGAGATVAGAAGTAGTSPTLTALNFQAGSGGGGGRASTTGNGGAGGNGGAPGGGGGGGGSAVTGSTAGTGGNGGDGAVLVVAYFG